MNVTCAPFTCQILFLQADGAAAAEAASPWPALPLVRSDSAAPPPMYPLMPPLLPGAQARRGTHPSSLPLMSRSAPCMCARATGIFIQRPPGPRVFHPSTGVCAQTARPRSQAYASLLARHTASPNRVRRVRKWGWCRPAAGAGQLRPRPLRGRGVGRADRVRGRAPPQQPPAVIQQRPAAGEWACV